MRLRSLPSPHFDVAALLIIKLGAQLILWLVLGFQFLTVDEFLRLSIAARIAHAWQWFPDLVFLPAMFWIYALPIAAGVPLRLGAIALTIAFSVGATLFAHRALLSAGTSRRVAFAGALLAMLQPLPLWLGGAPLAEMGTAFFLLAGVGALSASAYPVQLLGAAALALATLFRYEVWPVVALIALLHVLPRRNPEDAAVSRDSILRQFLIAALACSGVLFVAVWLGASPHRLDPAAAAYAPIPDSEYARVLPRFALDTVSCMPLAILSLLVVGVRFRTLLSARGHARTLLAMAGVSLVITIVLLQLAIVPVTYPERILFLPGLLLTLAAVVAADPWLTRVRPGWLASLTALTAIPLLFLASRPPVEVKPETLRTGIRLRALLATLPDDRQVLVQRADLGWTVLWGINDADPRLVFDRVRFAAAGVKELGAEEPSPIADRESAARFFAYHPELACAVGVSKPGIVDMGKAVPPSWARRWSDEKYSLYCAAGFGE